MSLSPPTIVIFDMDGTTVRHLNPWVLPVLEALDNFAFRCGKLWDWLWRKNKKPLLEFIDEDVEGALKKQKKPRLLVHRAIHKLRRKEVEQIVEPCPGIYEVLKLLQSRNIPIMLASNGLGKGYGHDILEKFGLSPFFGATIFREDVKKSKPHPEGILLALKKAEITPTEKDVVWHIGDRHKDVTATLAARELLPCKFEPVAYGVNAAVAVLEKNLGPDHIIMSYQDMFKRLKGML